VYISLIIFNLLINSTFNTGSERVQHQRFHVAHCGCIPACCAEVSPLAVLAERRAIALPADVLGPTMFALAGSTTVFAEPPVVHMGACDLCIEFQWRQDD
jgi:hypothetical protein